VRTWRARGTSEGARRCCAEHFVPAVLPELRSLGGFVGARVLVRQDGERAHDAIAVDAGSS
jgi:hypothetical protein